MNNLIEKLKNKIFFGALLIMASTFSSCMDDLESDIKIDPTPIPEGVKIGSADLGATYQNQVYYSLVSNQQVKVYTQGEFDLAFESTQNGWHILLNSSRFMHAGNTFNIDFNDVNSQAGVEMNFDNSNGSLDSTAIGNWANISGGDTLSYGFVYVIDLGLDANASPLGYRKIQLESLTDGKYFGRYANLDGSDETAFEIPKKPDIHFVGFSFANGGTIVDFEPPTSTYDIFIGQYTTMLYSGTEPYPYLVRGVLLNRTSSQAFQYMGEKEFSDIEFSDVSTTSFSPGMDVIGHEWKYYNLEEGFYSVDATMVYIIKNQTGNYYKLHFIGYYNENGQAGYPKFEFKKLN